MKYDNLLKTIFYDAMPSVLRGLHCAPLEEYLSVEFPARPKLVADVVARLADGKILHIEFQLTNDPRMHWRCYYYFGAIQEQWEDAEVLQVVIYLGNGPLTMQREIERPRLKYSYDILDIKDFDPKTFLESGSDSERVLAVLCASEDPRDTIRRVLASWKHLPQKELLENIDRLKTLSQLRGIEIIASEEIEHMPFELDISESIFFKEGEAKLLTRQLENRFGEIPDSIRQRLAQASTSQIEAWAFRIPDARNINEVFAD